MRDRFPPAVPPVRPAAARHEPPDARRAAHEAGVRADDVLPRRRAAPPPDRPLVPIAIGAALALVVSITPLLGMLGWYVRAFVHEIGHTVVGWLTGHASLPAISLFGQAATIHGERRPGLSWLMVALVAGLAWKLLRDGRRRAAVASAVGALVLAVAASSGALRLSLCLLGGHIAEIVVGAACLARAVRPSPDAEHEHRQTGHRAALAFAGSLLVGGGAVFAARLALSHEARVAYQGNGSFGCRNDLDRMADVTGLPVAGFGLAMLAACGAAAVATVVRAMRGR